MLAACATPFTTQWPLPPVSQNPYWVIASWSASVVVNRFEASTVVSPWVTVTFGAVTTGAWSGPGVAVNAVQAPHKNPSLALIYSVSGAEPVGPNT